MYQESVKKYYRLIHGIDVAVGAITETLRTTGQLKNTVIIFTSDNGFYLGEYGFAGKWYGSDASIRVPLLVYDGRSGAVRGVTAEQMVLNIDMAPTILGLAGLEAPAAMQGQNIMPLAQNSSQQIRSEFFYEHLWQSSPAYYIPSTQGVVTQNYKYMRYFLNENYSQPLFEELYDRDRDTHEVTNRMNDPAYTQARRAMLEKWEELRKGVK
jgi:arylsulfatase A-like enzyme